MSKLAKFQDKRLENYVFIEMSESVMVSLYCQLDWIRITMETYF